MSPERQTPSPEHEPEAKRPLFNLQQFDTADVARLYTALGRACEEDDSFEHILAILDNELEELPASHPEKARDVFFTMARDENEATRAAAAHFLGHLLRHDPDSSPQVLVTWARLLDENSDTDEAAYLAVCQAADNNLLDAAVAAELLDRFGG